MKRYWFLTVLVVLVPLFAACAPTTPQIVEVEKQVVVEKPVVETVVVEKQVSVEKKVVETVVVEKEVQQTVLVEQVKVITATPVPAADANDLSAVQELRYAMQAKLTHFDPAQETGYGRFMILNVFLPPFIADTDMNLMPGTCTDYDVSDDGLTYTLHVDPNAKWSDGSSFTAGDIKAWYEYAASPANPKPQAAAELAGIKGAVAVTEGSATEMDGLVVVDDHTLQVTLEQPNVMFPYTAFAKYRFGTAKADAAAANPTGWWLEDPLVTGPYMIDKFDSDLGEYSFVPNPNYWREPKPIIQKISVVTVQDPATIALMFENNQLDVCFIYGAAGHELEQKFPESVLKIGYTFPSFWSLNVGIEPTNDINVRKALKHAIDVPAIVQALYGDLRQPGDGPIMPTMAGYRSDLQTTNEFFTYDPELAREELAQSSYGSVENLPKIYVAFGNSSADKQRSMEMVMEMWRQNLGITNVESKVKYSDYGDDAAQILHFCGASLGGLPDAADYLGSFAGSSGALPSRYGYENPQLDELIQKASAMSRDDPQYIPTVQEAEDLVLADYMFCPMYWEEYFYYVKPWVKNLRSSWYMSWHSLPEVYLTQH